MKKAYIKPISECYEVNVQSIIALSVVDPNATQITSGHEGDFEVLGREDNTVSNVWDSEW